MEIASDGSSIAGQWKSERLSNKWCKTTGYPYVENEIGYLLLITYKMTQGN